MFLVNHEKKKENFKMRKEKNFRYKIKEKRIPNYIKIKIEIELLKMCVADLFS